MHSWVYLLIVNLNFVDHFEKLMCMINLFQHHLPLDWWISSVTAARCSSKAHRQHDTLLHASVHCHCITCKSQVWQNSQVSIFLHGWNMFKRHFCDLIRLLIYFMNQWRDFAVIFCYVWCPVCNKLQHCLYQHAESTSFLSLGFALHTSRFFFPYCTLQPSTVLKVCCICWSWNHFTVAVLYICCGIALVFTIFHSVLNFTCCIFSIVLESSIL